MLFTFITESGRLTLLEKNIYEDYTKHGLEIFFFKICYL